ncbi:PAS domain S-box protein [Methylomonas rapida]|uniref:histidine kinase n=1 Tax=Methylomonas rapida TaxID=2963939 RepID=A0ABY7GHV8_9GAMM|nr:PAS domain S-box protein [Methylomonas rapida]WAR43398.1 PAS domain S-box protein [Methylomonas rapida]
MTNITLSSRLFDTLGEGIVTITSTGEILSLNATASHVFGYENAEAQGQQLANLLAEPHASACQSQLIDAIDGQADVARQTIGKRKDGSIFPMTLTLDKIQIAGETGWLGIVRDLTPQKPTETIQAHYAAIVASSADAIIGKTLDGKITSWNPAASRMFGYSEQEMLGESIEILIPPNHAGEEQAIIARMQKGERIEHFETNRRRKNGETFPVSVTISPIRNDQGDIIGVSKIVRDITARRRAEIEGREHRFRTLFDTIVDGILVIDDKAHIQALNPAAVRLFGYQPVEVQGQNIKLLMPEPYASEHDGYLRNYLTTGIKKVIGIGREVTGRRKDGSTFPMELAVSEMEVDGERMFTGIVRDITQRKQAEAEIQVNENRFRALFDTIVDGIIVIDARGHIQALNPAAVDLFGYSPHEAQGQNVKILMPEPYASEHDGYLHNYLTTGIEKVIGIGREVLGKRKDGTTFPIDLAVSEMKVGNERMFTGIVRDITQRKEIETALNRASEMAVKANQAKTEFLASMSHELRTPLNAILGFSQLFELEADLPAEYRDYAGEITRAGKHLLALINDLIDLSRIESGKLEMTTQSVKVLDVIHTSIQLVTPLANEQDISLVNTTPTSENWTVKADAVRLRQVIINLLSNAIKYNYPGGRVMLGCRRHQAWVDITVTDTGSGIPVEMQNRVFTAFDRLGRETGTTVGTGIGLVITRQIVEAMGGRIGFESLEGTGSTFWVRLPEGDNTGPALSPAAADSDRQRLSISVERHKLLYIEDNPVNVRLMEQLFAKRKHIDFHTAPSAELGLASIHRALPALILMDINLPGMNGYEAMERLKADPKTTAIPIIALSANAMKEDIERGKRAGFSHYLTKPVDLVKLLAIVDALLR